MTWQVGKKYRSKSSPDIIVKCLHVSGEYGFLKNLSTILHPKCWASRSFHLYEEIIPKFEKGEKYRLKSSGKEYSCRYADGNAVLLEIKINDITYYSGWDQKNINLFTEITDED